MKGNFVDSRRFKREKKTLEAMIGIHCRGTHGLKGNLCPECKELLDYSLERLEKCPFGPGKPACNTCPIHCYKPEMRKLIRAVMRHAGPRMLLPHPLLSLWHFLDKRKKGLVQNEKEKRP